MASATILTYDRTNATHNATDLTPTSSSPTDEITLLNSIFGQPFYELTNSNTTGSEIISLSPPVTKDSYSGQGFMQGVGNITEQGTYVSTYFPHGYISDGEGMIFSEDGQFITFTAKDIGFSDSEGNFMYKGAMIFNSNETTGELANLDKRIGLYITWEDDNGTSWSKTWLWE
jgi:hypothetical protein